MRCQPTKTTLALLLSAGLASAALVGASAQAAAQMSDRSARLAQLVSEYPLLNDDGERIPNHRVKLATPIDTMPGVGPDSMHTGWAADDKGLGDVPETL